jgi:hypothetical protein
VKSGSIALAPSIAKWAIEVNGAGISIDKGMPRGSIFRSGPLRRFATMTRSYSQGGGIRGAVK